MSLIFADPAAAGRAEEEAARETRVHELLSRMTLEEKIGQMRQIHADHRELPPDLRAAIAKGRVGSLINAVSLELNNEAQRVAVEQSRLGIPLLIGRDVIHGFRTTFPIPLGLAATFDPSLVQATARAAAQEAASLGINWTFAPMIDVTRDPRWGRIAESPGEDPYLASALAVAMVQGFQGDDLSAGDSIAGCAKHFAGYGASEAGRDYNTTNIPENELRNVHLVPFRAAVQAGVASIMASFSDLNGVPATGNRWLFREVLRDEWEFNGVTVSDWASIPELADHGFAADDRGSALAAFSAGIDMEMATTTYQAHLPGLLEDGAIEEGVLDAMVANILRLKLRLGLFEHPVVDPTEPSPIAAPEHLELARQAALESLVLLKNDGGLLPLDTKAVRSVAVIGPLADSPPDQLGTWIFDADRSLAVTPLAALRGMEALEVNYARALETSRSRDTGGFDAALEAAGKSDAVLLFLGEEAIITGEAHSRADIRLPGAQQELVRAVTALAKPTVLIVLAGRPLALQDIVDDVPAILYAWHPGARGGPAIVDVLFGRESPSGKLPATFPRVVGQVPIYYNHKPTGRPPTEATFVAIDDIPVDAPQTSLGNTSHHLDAGFTPLFPFGHGLSYGHFVYDAIAVDKPRLAADGEIELAATVTNTGAHAATEVAQLYVRDLVGDVTRPVRELKGFQRIRLAPGQSTTVRFKLRPEDLAFYGRNMRRVIEPGRFHAWIGGSSATELRTEFELLGD